MAPSPTPTAPTGSPVECHGKLRVQGNKIVDKNGQPVQFKGMSYFWSQWQGQYWNAGTVGFLADNWGATLVRAAMGVDQGGYLSNPGGEKAKVMAVVDAAIARGIYVIIDWHDHHAEDHVQEAKTFFTEMAQRYGQYPNVIFETFNEPLQVDWSGVIKPYHDQLVPLIRSYAPDSIIVLGTKTWSQDVDEASYNPVQGSNLAYTLHFYAATHKQELRDKARTALNRGIALFVTEWGTCDASGDGNLDLSSSGTWLSFLNQHHISHANWAVSDKVEAASALRPGASTGGGWGDQDLTPSGSWIRAKLRGQGGGNPSPTPGGGGGGCCRFEADCGDCGEDGTGWCHQSASNCATCTGTFDPTGSPPAGCGGPGGGNPSPAAPTPAAPAGSPVEQHGRLSVAGNEVVGENGDTVQLKGMSFFWSQWQGQYYTTGVVNWMVDDWKCSLVRAVLGIHESSGYLQDPGTEKAKIELVVNAAIAKGIYVLIDWHDHHAEWHINEAKAFFTEMAQKYGSYPHVLFETYNEPLAVSWSGVIKPYHQQLVSVIRQYSDNIIVLGNRDWDQHPDEAARDPVSGSNLAYTIHFYASTHKGELRDKIVQAKSAGAAVFATEWGTCRADGNGQLDFGETQVWLDFLAYHGVSYANWAINDKQESCSALAPGANTNGGWSDGELSASGRFMKGAISGRGGGSGGCCRFEADCGDCGLDGTGWCHHSSSNCAQCGGSLDPSGSAPGCP